MTKPMYRLFPHLFAFNVNTKKHVRKDSNVYKKQFAANPELFRETESMFPPVNVPATIPERIPEAKAAPPSIGNPLPEPERVLTRAEIDAALSRRAQERVRDLVDTELKTNPDPYNGLKSPELEVMLRAFIKSKLDNAPVKKGKPKFLLRPVAKKNEESSSSGGSDSDDYDDPEY